MIKTMTQRIRNQQEALCHLHKASKTMRKAILDRAPPDLVRALCECVCNLYAGNIPMTDTQRRILQHHGKSMSLLMNRRVPLQHKRKVLNQRGGFLGALLAAAVPAVMSLLNGR